MTINFKNFVLTSMLILASSAPMYAAEEKGAALIDIELVGATQTDKDDAAVIAALQKLLQAMAHRNIEHISAALSDDVTTFDAKTKQYLHGKQTVVDHIKKTVIGTQTSHPVKRLIVHNPFVHVKGETAMVSFRATKEMNDANATALESWCSEVFERKNGNWVVLHLNTEWKPLKKSTKQAAH
jgi:ketosteroid isomerase-like protein